MDRVALLHPCFWPEVRRGGERLIRELADGLIGAGVAPTLITSHPGPPSRRDEAGLRVLRLPRPPEGVVVRRGYERYLLHAPGSYAALRVGHFWLAHAMYPPDARAVAAWKRATGRPGLLTYLGTPDAAGLDQYRLHRRLVSHAVEHLDAVVAISRHAAAAFADQFGYRAPVIHPGVDLDAFGLGTERSPHPTIVCAADPSEPRKHVSLLIAAHALVRRELPRAELILSAPRRLPEAPGVVWRDLDDRATLAATLGRAHVAVLPAESEAFGLVLVEALACGTPVVGYADAAIPEVIDSPRIGRLFRSLDAPALAAAILEAITLQDREACRARAAAYSTTAMTRAYLRLYRQATAAA